MFDLESLIPHRKPMLLLDKAFDVTENSAIAGVDISPASSFYVEGKGVPAWIGVEYMGQTAALIAGWQLRQGLTQPHLGLLLGTRKFSAFSAWFARGDQLRVSASEVAVVGEGLATFYCEIHQVGRNKPLATAKLSVMRRAIVRGDGRA